MQPKYPLALLVLALALPLAADVLTMKDGSRIETRGAIEVKGRRVLFTNTKGQLVALQLADVDLDAGSAKSAPARGGALLKTAPEAGQAEKRQQKLPIGKAPRDVKVVMVLTDKDVAHVDPDSLEIKEPQLQKSVVMYSTSWCPACKAARSYFEQKGILFTEYDVEADQAAKLRKDAKSPGCGVPVIDVGGQIFCGFSGAGISRALGDKKGKT